MSNKIDHIELTSSDRAATAKFFEDLFGWPTQTFEAQDYLMTAFEDWSDTSMAFIQENQEFGYAPGSVLVYIDVADVDAAVARAQELGATVIMPKMEVENTGWMAHLAIPGGNRIALMQRMPMPAG